MSDPPADSIPVTLHGIFSPILHFQPFPFTSLLFVLHISLNYHTYGNKQAKGSIICTECQIFPVVSGDLRLPRRCMLGKEEKKPVSWKTGCTYLIGCSGKKVGIWQSTEGEERREACGTFTYFSPLGKSTTHRDPMSGVRKCRCLYWNKNRLSKQQVTPKHVHPHPQRTPYCPRLRLFKSSVSAHFCQNDSLFLSANYPSLSHYWPLFCHAGSNADEPT